MNGKLLAAALLIGGCTVAMAADAPPPAGGPGAAGGGQRGGMMDPAARFKQMDTNGDGKLSADEFAAMPMRGGPGGPPGGGPPGGGQGGPPGGGPPGGGQGGPPGGPPGGAMMSAADRFKAADTNKDGSVSMDEYSASMAGMMRRGGGGN
jgi:hypothetical protein